MKRRTLSGSCGVGIFVIAFVCICIAFATPSWIVSDYRITGAKLDRLGLWTHCFRSLPDVNDDYQRRFFVGCRWVFDPFTTGYDEIRGFLIPRKDFFECQTICERLCQAKCFCFSFQNFFSVYGRDGNIFHALFYFGAGRTWSGVIVLLVRRARSKILRQTHSGTGRINRWQPMHKLEPNDNNNCNKRNFTLAEHRLFNSRRWNLWCHRSHSVCNLGK